MRIIVFSAFHMQVFSHRIHFLDKATYRITDLLFRHYRLRILLFLDLEVSSKSFSKEPSSIVSRWKHEPKQAVIYGKEITFTQPCMRSNLISCCSSHLQKSCLWVQFELLNFETDYVASHYLGETGHFASNFFVFTKHYLRIL